MFRISNCCVSFAILANMLLVNAVVAQQIVPNVNPRLADANKVKKDCDALFKIAENLHPTVLKKQKSLLQLEAEWRKCNPSPTKEEFAKVGEMFLMVNMSMAPLTNCWKRAQDKIKEANDEWQSGNDAYKRADNAQAIVHFRKSISAGCEGIMYTKLSIRYMEQALKTIGEAEVFFKKLLGTHNMV